LPHPPQQEGGVIFVWESGALSLVDSKFTSCSAYNVSRDCTRRSRPGCVTCLPPQPQDGGVVFAKYNVGAVSLIRSIVEDCSAGVRAPELSAAFAVRKRFEI